MQAQEFDLCQNILRLTNDGDNLRPGDLSLVEAAANNNLTPRGQVVLYQLNYKIEQGQYDADPNWFCGIENLTRGKGDDRSVFWRGIRIEHYDHDFWRSGNWQEEMQRDADKLAKTCRYLEENHIEVNFDNYLKFVGRFRN